MEKHEGPVRGLHFNIHQPKLLASGSSKSQANIIFVLFSSIIQLLIWDLGNASKPSLYTFPMRSQSDIVSVQWNPKVPHILATAHATSLTSIWDLRAKKQVIAFQDRNQHQSVCACAWNPEVVSRCFFSVTLFSGNTNCDGERAR